MRIACIGGGPGGLYFAILMKKAFPGAEIAVYERNRPDDTFGFGVVFSDETLGHFKAADPESFAEVERSFVYWTDIETHFQGAVVRSTGHGFCGLSRVKLLQILHGRCRDLGVELCFEREVAEERELGRCDLVVACDGSNSAFRARYAATFQPTLHWGRCRFAWLGTTVPLEAFTFIFRSNSAGLFQVHAYPYERGDKVLSTWIVECREEVWRRAGLEHASEADTCGYIQELFAEDLRGHPLLANRSIWRSFPTVRCRTWRQENLVLLGDAAHTAHFSIGSGTKLALEDAMALAAAFQNRPRDSVADVLAVYEQARMVETLKLQRAADTSRLWFETCGRYAKQPPEQFTFNLLTRSKRITYDNLRLRDPELVARASARFAASVPGWSTEPGAPPPPMFAPLRLRSLVIENRVAVSPMCQYSAVDGTVGDWHLVHLGSRAVGGAGLVFTEMTDVSADGRITHGCAGMYADEHEKAWRRIVDFVHAQTRAKIALQLAHSGRKGSCNLPWEGDDPLRDERAWQTIAPSAIPFAPGWPEPRAMDRSDMEAVRAAFCDSALRADRAGFDALELHMAHGYLLSSFISPVSNHRKDEYGGALASRMRYPLEVFDAVRSVWPEPKPLFVRISASDWLEEGGLTEDDAVAIARMLAEHGCDMIDVSSGGNTPLSKPVYGRMYQVPFADRIRHEVGVAVMTVGAIQSADHVNTILAAGRADMCALARAHLVRPYLTLEAAASYGYHAHPWPSQYLPARPERR